MMAKEARELSIDGFEENSMGDIHWSIIDEINRHITAGAQMGFTSIPFKLNPTKGISTITEYLKLLGYKAKYLHAGEILIEW